MLTETEITEELQALETQTELQKQIDALEAKKREAQRSVEQKENEDAKVEMPLADIRLKLDKNGSDIVVKNVTPAQLLFLVAEHHANAGGSPVTSIKPTGKTVMRDPRWERSRLSAMYSDKKIAKLFPGSEPVLPKTFSRALGLGVSIELGSDKFLTFNVEPHNSGVE